MTEVLNWFQQIPKSPEMQIEFQDVEKILRSQSVDGIVLYEYLKTDQDWENLGVKKIGIRNKLLNAQKTFNPNKTSQLQDTNPNKNIGWKQWDISAVIQWSKSLKLVKDYSKLFRYHCITGEILDKYLKEEKDWKELGITEYGEIRKLLDGVRRL